MGWWFGRILTFEVIADDPRPTIGSILADASAGAISTDADAQLIGFAAYGRSITSAVGPLVELFDVELFDDGERLQGPASGSPIVIEESELGNGADEHRPARLQREQRPAGNAASTIRLTYYDAARDYQIGEARASSGEQRGNEIQEDLPAVVDAADAKALAQQLLARRWAERDRLTLRLPPKRLGLEPGTKVELPLTPALWSVEKTAVDGFVLVAELKPLYGQAAAISADAGRIVGSPDTVAGPLSLALFDIPNVLGLSANEPVLLLATSASGIWKSRPADIAFGGQDIAVQTPRAKSILGTALTKLGAADSDLIDTANSVDIDLIDDDQWLTSCDDDAFASGENICVLGGELIQFGVAISLGSGRFRLSRLLRGRAGTEWAAADHAIGEAFCLIQANALRPVPMPSWAVGAAVEASGHGATSPSLQFGAESLRPPSPMNLTARREGNGDLFVSWTRRSRQGFAWVDQIDAPLGETVEQYRVEIIGAGTTVEFPSGQPSLTISQASLATVGAGPATIEVRQIGDFAASRPAQIQIIL